MVREARVRRVLHWHYVVSMSFQYFEPLVSEVTTKAPSLLLLVCAHPVYASVLANTSFFEKMH
jgi:hypothetical protein